MTQHMYQMLYKPMVPRKKKLLGKSACTNVNRHVDSKFKNRYVQGNGKALDKA
jgi:hypothetical protein